METSRKNKNNNKGAALVFAIVCLTVVMAFCFLILIVAYKFLSSTNNKKNFLQASEAAKSFSDVMEKKITLAEGGTNNVYNYLKQNMDETKWPSFYTKDNIDGISSAEGISPTGHLEDDSFRYFNLTGDDKNCTTSVCMYWIRTGTNQNGAILHVRTISTCGEQTYMVEAIYKLSITVSGNDQTWTWSLKSKMY